jgi:NAD(P)-dependent dehydrogenase (short-subunit alcohol dehydrogenase family)
MMAAGEGTQPVMLVTGGTGSIGGAVAALALATGWRVALHGRTEASAAAMADRLRPVDEADERLRGFGADVLENEDAIARLVEAAGGWADRLDAVVDCISGGRGGFRVTGRFADTEPGGYAPLLDYSVVNLQRLAHAALPWLSQQGGTLIALASDAGKFAAPRQALIASSRAAIMAFARNLALETARDGVRVHCVSPSFVDESRSLPTLSETGKERLQTARKRAGLGLPTPDDIAPLVLFLCGDGARRISGQVISVNGGMNA